MIFKYKIFKILKNVNIKSKKLRMSVLNVRNALNIVEMGYGAKIVDFYVINAYKKK